MISNKKLIYIIIILSTIFSAVLFFKFFEIKPIKKELTFIPTISKEVFNTSTYHNAIPMTAESYDIGYKISKDSLPEIKDKIRGGIVPHHLISAHTLAKFFETVKKDKPKTIVLIGPNHFDQGNHNIITTMSGWNTPFGAVNLNTKLTQQILDNQHVHLLDQAFTLEHSIGAVVPFIAKSLPDTTVVPILVKNNTPRQELDELITSIINNSNDDVLFVGSIDFSHYQSVAVANFHDERTINIIKRFDFDRIDEAEIDSHATLYTILSLMEQRKSQKIAYSEHTNSAMVIGRRDLGNTTSHYVPYFVDGKKSDEEPLVNFLFFGDMMLDRGVQQKIDQNGGADYLFKKLALQEDRFFKGVDVIHANLEGPFADYRRQTSKSIAFRFDPLLIDTLKKYNFDMFTLANNHSLDMSSAGFEESKANLKKNDILYYGNQFSIKKDSVLIKEISGKQIGFIGFNDTNKKLNTDEVKALISSTKKITDHVIVNIHWGQEYKELSNARQQTLAHLMIDAGADAIIGHHPHVVQEMEVYKDKPIFYSLGNFIFDQWFSIPTQQSIAVGLGFDGDSISTYVFPLEGRQSQVMQMPFEKSEFFMKYFIKRSKLPSPNFKNYHLNITQAYGK